MYVLAKKSLAATERDRPITIDPTATHNTCITLWRGMICSLGAASDESGASAQVSWHLGIRQKECNKHKIESVPAFYRVQA